MKLLLDTNIILDFLLDRDPFGIMAREILYLAAKDEAYEYVSSSAITDIFYIAKKQLRSSSETQKKIGKLISIIKVLAVSNKEINDALALEWNDFEDAVQYVTARNNNVDIIISRNKEDYECTDIPIMTPDEFLKYIK